MNSARMKENEGWVRTHPSTITIPLTLLVAGNGRLNRQV